MNMKNNLKIKYLTIALLGITLFLPICLSAQKESPKESQKEKTEVAAAPAVINLSFPVVDSVKTFNAKVTAGDKPVKDVAVKFYVKRFFSNLPVGKEVTTDENGVASVNFITQLPGDSLGNLTVIAKIDEDETVGTLESIGTVKWGKEMEKEDMESSRSFSASRSHAPIPLIIAANVIIFGVWATLLYVVYSLVRIKKASGIKKKVAAK